MHQGSFWQKGNAEAEKTQRSYDVMWVASGMFVLAWYCAL
jgi:hypothetical protein